MLHKFSLIISFALVLLTSCAEEEVKNQSQVIGEWKLTNYSFGAAVDIDKDGTSNLNLLNEIECANNEILKFETTGIVSSNDTYNPTINVFISNDGSSYEFSVDCAEGIIGFATDFSQISSNTFKFNDTEFTIVNNTFDIILVNEIEIYNEDFTQVVETRDLVLTYSRL